MRVLSKAGRLSLTWFLSSTAILLLLILDYLCDNCSKALGLKRNIWFFSLAYSMCLIVYLRLRYVGFLFQVTVRSVFLGTIFSFGMITTFISSTQWNLFGIYICVMSFFHYSEFLTISWCNPKTLTLSSFLLNHSPQYNFAAIASWIEFALEMYYIPGLKQYYVISGLGFLLCVMGEALRKTAMVTGSINFDHIVQTEKKEKHKLIKHGVYSIFRHPSYVGWFYWSIGTQLILVNPICVIGYTIASWGFFNERILHEEQALVLFFGEEYLEYQKAVRTGLPGIKGFVADM